MNGYKNQIDYPNGYSASIISNEYSYGGNRGLFEVAVLYNNKIDYTTSITNDVLGFLSFEEVNNVCKDIENLPSK